MILRLRYWLFDRRRNVVPVRRERRSGISDIDAAHDAVAEDITEQARTIVRTLAEPPCQPAPRHRREEPPPNAASASRHG